MNPTRILETYGSPLYVYDAQQVRRALAEFRAAFPYPDTRIHYAIVCNKNPYLVKMLHREGAGIHANTPGDAFAALQAGVPASDIVYSGTNLDAGDFRFLLNHGLRLHLDSLDQLRDRAGYGAVAPIELGLRLWLPQGAARIGVAPEELPEAVEIARQAGLRLTSLHMYTATNNRKVERFVEALEGLVRASDRLPDLESLNLGGGYGVGYRAEQSPLDLAQLGRVASAQMEALSQRRGRPIALVLEPGRILVARAGTLYVRVVSLKIRQGRRFVGVDSTVGNLAAESVYHTYHRLEAVNPRGPALDIATDICGNTTHSRDYLARNCRLPHLEIGDALAVCDVGAYGYAMSSHFLNRPRPAEVVLDGQQLHLTTRRETLQDLLVNLVTA